MSYNLVVQRSLGGFGDADWTTFATLTGVTPGDPFSVVDSPVPPGQLRVYRARYECASDPATVSEWAYTYGRGPYDADAAQGATMCNVITSARTAFGVSNPERNQGQPCKVQHYLDFHSHNVDLARGYSETQANRNVVSAVSDEGPAITRIQGAINADFLPGGAFMRLLLTGYGLVSGDTTTIAADAGPPSIPEHYRHRLKPSYVGRPITGVSKEGDYAFVIPGMQFNTLTYRASKTQTEKIRVDYELYCLNKLLYNALSANELALLGLDTGAYSLLTALNPTDWVLSINDVAAPCSEHGLTFNRNLVYKDVGDNTMGASCIFATKSAIQVTATLYWETLDELKAFWGWDSSATLPIGVVKTVKRKKVSVLYTPPDNSDNYANSVEIVAPVCSIRTLVRSIPENGPIMQEITVQPIQDPANGRIDHYIDITNGETFANLTDIGSEIGYVPDNDIQTYKAIPARVSGVPTTTVFAAAATYLGGTYLSASDDKYNGKTIRFISGALAGQERVVTDYTGATRTFTVGVALGSAPVVGVDFIVLDVDPG
jgi:hypothetical protein